MQVDFYHLDRAPLDRVLPRLADRVLGQGARLLVVADDAALARIDELLWIYDPESFLPHGRAGEAEGDQPILLSTGPAAANGARMIALADGVWREEALGFDRALYLFDAAMLAEARTAWRALADREGVERRYWKQDDAGKWRQGP